MSPRTQKVYHRRKHKVALHKRKSLNSAGAGQGVPDKNAGNLLTLHGIPPLSTGSLNEVPN